MANIYKQNDQRKKVIPGGEQALPVREEVVVPSVEPPVEPKRSKSLTRTVSFTLQEEAIEKLNALAEEQDISRSKILNRWLMSL